MSKLLVIDDEPLICQSFQWVFAKDKVQVSTAGTLEEGWRLMEQESPDVIVLDLQLPDGSGLDLFTRIHAAHPRKPVIFLTAHGTTETAIEAMKRGAFDYISKPFDLGQMTTLLERALETARLMDVPAALPEDLPTDQIVGRSSAIREICKHIGRVSPLDATVLLLGESGTGKELFARAIYQHSQRSHHPFLAINCAAIPEGLVESELFGHEPGAFTGAQHRRIGRFEQANEGTLFLDEIGDMPLNVQAKILRFLQDQTFERVGGNKSIRTRVRILAATNHNIDQLIEQGRFRRDLYYRLNEITIQIPPLRERQEDIGDLAQHFLFQFIRETGKDVNGFTDEALEALRHHAWLGNVRELRAVVREAALRATGGVILREHLPGSFLAKQLSAGQAGARFPAGLGRNKALHDSVEAMLKEQTNNIYHLVMEDTERQLLAQVLEHTKGHQSQTADLLGIDRKTLRNKLRELGIVTS
ncbi:MAG: sigma-54 dependent transcriptional regulator [Gemmatales bacterium]